MNTRSLRSLFLAALACLAAPIALAQPGAQRDLDRLASDNPAEVQQARSAIITAIGDPGMAVGDRLAASGQLIEPVRALLDSGDENEIVNGLMIAGHIVTPEAISLIEGTYGHELPGVRYAATRALRTSMRILGSQRTASLQSPEVSRQIKAAGKLLVSDPDPFVAEGAARALIQTAKITDSRLAVAAEEAFGELARGVSARLAGIGSLPEEKREGVVRLAMLSTFELGRILQTPGRKPGEAIIRDAAALAGDALGYVYKRFTDSGRQISGIDAAESALLAQLVGSSETLVFFAQGALGAAGEQPQLRANFEAANDRDFNRNILTMIGGTGLLTRPPFSLKADRFVPAGG